MCVLYPILERLVANVTTVGRPDPVREASLEALGYICQDIVSASFSLCVCVCVLQDRSSDQGMRSNVLLIVHLL